MENTQISEFGIILLFITGGIAFVALALFVSKLIRPDRPNFEKLTPYESGEDPIGNAWGQFNTRFYVIALIFLLFEVEIVFIFPWATVFGDKNKIEETQGLWGWFSLMEMFLFIGILALGLIYAWVKGYLDWVKPNQEVKDYKSPVPKNLYEEINKKYHPSDEVRMTKYE
jgi:NADH-quinone oxidoreductase subunit A